MRASVALPAMAAIGAPADPNSRCREMESARWIREIVLP
jgi:hypothetical protein